MMNKNKRNRSSNVERLARDLPRDIQPPTDLWPGIEARLDTPSVTEVADTGRSWPQAAAGAVVLVLASSLATIMWLRGSVSPAPPAAEKIYWSTPAGDGLHAPELLAISALSDEDRDILVANLDILRAARSSIEHQLAVDPNNTGLHISWLRVYEQELDLLNEATWTTNGLAERVKT